ncbi:MAG TPA: HAD hydrolase family protein [Candidatus Saccharimonadales bacterium]|nr:HAD hydrolase family protein [Candidatus Saccharimonadales bacterium]
MARWERVAACDIDATLIAPNEKLPSKAVQAAASALRKNKTYLTLHSSRSHKLIENLVEPLGLRGNLCALDGGATIASANKIGKVVESHWLTPELTGSVVTKIGGLCTRIHYDTVSRSRTREQVLASASNGTIPAEGAASVFGIFNTADSDNVLGALAELSGIHHTPVMDYHDKPGLQCIQVFRPGINKRHGLERVLHYAGLERLKEEGELYIFADGKNDLDLFAAAGDNCTKIALGNACEELKDAANWVAPPVEEDGVVAGFYRYGLLK